MDKALEFLAVMEDEPMDQSRAAAAAHLEAFERLHHPKHDVKIPETLKQWNFILTLIDHEKFPAVKRTEELEAIINGLKAEAPGGHVFKELLAYQDEVVAKMAPREQVPGLYDALLKASASWKSESSGSKVFSFTASLEFVASAWWTLCACLLLCTPGNWSAWPAPLSRSPAAPETLPW